MHWQLEAIQCQYRLQHVWNENSTALDTKNTKACIVVDVLLQVLVWKSSFSNRPMSLKAYLKPKHCTAVYNSLWQILDNFVLLLVWNQLQLSVTERLLFSGKRSNALQYEHLNLQVMEGSLYKLNFAPIVSATWANVLTMHVSVSCRVWGKSFCVWFIALDCRPGLAADWGWSTDRMCESGEPVCQSESCHWQRLSEVSVSNCLLDEGGLYIWTHRRSTHSLVCSICNYILSQTITRTPVVPNWSRCAGILFQPYINIAI